MNVDRLLCSLEAAAARPRAQAVGMPAALFVSEDILALELDAIFAREWHCVGRADEFDEPGAYRTLTIGRDPVIVLRGTDGELRALSNVCRHRMMTLVEGAGRLEGGIACPYHGWTYKHDGRLIGGRHMPDDFDPSTCRLPQFRTEVWEGWLYVNLDPAAEPLGPRLAPLSARYARFRIADYRTLFRVEEIWDTNWKILVENFMEGYHLFRVHARTVEHVLPTRLSDPVPGGDGYCLYEQGRIPGRAYEYGAAMDVVNPGLTEAERLIVPLFCAFPAHVVSVSPERTFWLALQPEGVDKVRVLWGVDVFPDSFPEGEEGERRAAELRASFERINDEDKPIVSAIARNARALAAAPGRLSPKEATLWEFQRYLARRLCPGPAGAA